MFHNLVAQTLDSGSPAGDAGAAAGGALFLVLTLLLSLLVIVGMWKTYAKAGQPGWAAIIPIYNIYILQQVAGRPGWWTILYFVPFVNFVVAIINGADVGKRFGYGPVFGAILCGLLGIGYLIIGFGNSTYNPGTAPVSV